MKTILKVIAIILLVIVGLIAALFIKGATTPAVPKGYTETTETGGEIEKTYLKNGPFETTYFEKKTDEDFKNMKSGILKSFRTVTAPIRCSSF